MIQVKKLEKSYDNVNHLHILQNLNLTVEDGEFLGIMGASGSGKSTFLRILGGLETFSGGEAEVCGEFADDEGCGERALQAESSFICIPRLQSAVGADSKRKYHFALHNDACRGKGNGTGLYSHY